MELQTKDLILRTLNVNDIDDLSRTVRFDESKITRDEAQKAIENMMLNHNINKPGYIYHLTLAVYEKGKPDIIGWCGLDGKVEPDKVTIYYMIIREHRNKGFAAQCASRLLSFAFEEYGLKCVHGGCFKENVASYKVQQKIGMIQHAFDENGNPLFYVDDKTYYANKPHALHVT